jgi:(1->4)-alpha-D-glucan 1-alpha-D-glucosylmutase
MPAEWRLTLRRWTRMNRTRKREADGVRAPEPNEEYLHYQTLLGTFPTEDLDEDGLASYRSRIAEYMVKAVREAKVRSSWINVNAPYEEALTAFVDALLGKPEGNLFLDDLKRQARTIAWFGALNGVSMALVKATSPGVPDIYQGTELTDLSLVDPDNRRPVDYARRGQILDTFGSLARQATFAAGAHALANTAEDGRAKLWTLWRALGLRRERPELFEHGGYQPLATTGAHGDHVVAYARMLGGHAIIAIAGRLWSKLGGAAGTLPLGETFWQDTAVDLAPLGEVTDAADVLTGKPMPPGNGTLRIADAYADFPGALIFCRIA